MTGRETTAHDLVLQPYNGMGDDWYKCSRCGLRYCPEYDDEPGPTCPAVSPPARDTT